MEVLELRVESEFEECLEFTWRLTNGDSEKNDLKDSTVEMVLDRTAPDHSGPLRPAKDAMVKRVPMGKERKGCVQNMPEARRFLISVAGVMQDGKKVRSPWVRATTLNPNTRPSSGNLDPTSLPRLGCKLCPCLGYVPQKWDLNSAGKMRCRRCGCSYQDHLLVEADEILKARENKFLKKMKGWDKVAALPREALEWDGRECSLWFMSDGEFHPRETVGLNRKPLSQAEQARPGGAYGLSGRKGRVSVMTPTTESRQKFHKSLWECFVAQEWEDKELVVVETYFDAPSDYLAKIAAKDDRLIYVRYKRPRDKDWSIGFKRNLCAHLATGEFIANFDDDDLYAPSYLTTMVPQLADRSAQVVTLSSWYIFQTKSSKWAYCDAIQWGWLKGMDSDCQDVKSWAYGYGFSYVHCRQELMDFPYDNVNMGEDYGFVSKVIAKRGDKSVYLFHDEFGICLHTQHGANTSNAFPVREVDLEEAGALDVADLPREVVGSCLEKVGYEQVSHQGRGHRMLTAHTQQGEIHVLCTAGVTVEEFLRLLSGRLQGPGLGQVKVFRVPVGDLPKEAGQGTDEWLAELLAFKLEEIFEEEVSEEAAGKVRAEKGRIMAKARHSMHIRDRISLRTRDLWVVPASMVDEEDEVDLGFDESTMLIEITVQTTGAKSHLLVGNSIQARLPHGSTVGGLRALLKEDLPKRARVLEHRPGKGLVPLQDEDQLPSQVTVTEFTGRKAFYNEFTWEMCRFALSAMKTSLQRASVQRMLEDLRKECKLKHGDGTEDFHQDYRGGLSQLLLNEIYPPVFRYFGFPPGAQGLRYFVKNMGQVSSSLQLAELWYEVESLMQNAKNMSEAEAAISRLRSEGRP